MKKLHSEVLENYKQMKSRLDKKTIKRPLTFSEKILYSHLSPSQAIPQNREGFISLRPNRVAMQDATAQMALLQFMLAGKTQTETPTTVHCDHLIRAEQGEKKDMKQALSEHGEVFDFLSSASSRYGIEFWGPGSGIIHQVVLEKYAYPGGLLIGTDSHTPNAGGIGMMAVGVGGADAADVMAGLDWEVKHPKLLGVHLTGSLKGWTASKDVILKLLKILTVKGGTNRIVEYFGEGCRSISCTGKATITNMGAELGATCSIFPYDDSIYEYLKATDRKEIAELTKEYSFLLKADDEVIKNPHSFYDEVIEINLSELEPHLCGPSSPDWGYPVKQIKEEAQKKQWPCKLSACLIGSCTNSSYEDISKAAHVARQAHKYGLKMPQPFYITPGSDQIKKTIERDGMMEDFKAIGATVLSNACGPCIGQWKRSDYKKGEKNTIINSFNRNFKGRNDANPETLSFIGSPEMVVAIGLSGRLDFNPETDKINDQFQLQPPKGESIPQKGFSFSFHGFQQPKGESISVVIAPNSERLQKLTPFTLWKKENFQNLSLLCKVKGKCTTDHISPAGYWLRYRGHLDRISDNLLLTAENSFHSLSGEGFHPLTKEKLPFNKIARDLKSKNKNWVIIGGQNYGEGSSREHAAMTPRYLGCAFVLAQSFARIHETNLKKQGVIPFTFVSESDYDKIEEYDRFSVSDIESLAPKSIHHLEVEKTNGDKIKIQVTHSLNQDQVKWFWKGSALNYLRDQA